MATRKPKVKRKPKLEDKAQYAVFLKTAKALEVDESGKAFERVFEKIVVPRSAKPRQK